MNNKDEDVKYFNDKDGNFIGTFIDGAIPSEDSVECSKPDVKPINYSVLRQNEYSRLKNKISECLTDIAIGNDKTGATARLKTLIAKVKSDNPK